MAKIVVDLDAFKGKLNGGYFSEQYLRHYSFWQPACIFDLPSDSIKQRVTSGLILR
jgi:hypothetical protein